VASLQQQVDDVRAPDGCAGQPRQPRYLLLEIVFATSSVSRQFAVE